MRFHCLRRRLHGALSAPRPTATRTFSDKPPPPQIDAQAKELGLASSMPDVAEVPDTSKVLQIEEYDQQADSIYASVDVGRAQTMEFRRFLTAGGAQCCSAWHDVPLFAKQSASSTVLNACIEITRGTRAKMEMSTTEVMELHFRISLPPATFSLLLTLPIPRTNRLSLLRPSSKT